MAPCYIYLVIVALYIDKGLGSTMRPGGTLLPGVTATPAPRCMVPSNNPTTDWMKESFPNPRVNVTLCGRQCVKSWICDPSGILSPKDADILDDEIDTIAVNGHCGCRKCVSGKDGYKIGVALVRKMGVKSFVVSNNVDKVNQAMEFSAYLRSVSWKFGTCDNSIVIFYSQDDRMVMTSTGARVNHVLTVNCTEDIFNEVKPMLKGDQVFEALHHMVIRYGEVLQTGLCHPPKRHRELGVGTIVIIVVLCIVFVVVATIAGVCGWRRTHGGYHRGRSHDPDKGNDEPKTHRGRSHDPEKDSDEPKTFSGGETGDGGGVGGGSF